MFSGLFRRNAPAAEPTLAEAEAAPPLAAPAPGIVVGTTSTENVELETLSTENKYYYDKRSSLLTWYGNEMDDSSSWNYVNMRRDYNNNKYTSKNYIIDNKSNSDCIINKWHVKIGDYVDNGGEIYTYTVIGSDGKSTDETVKNSTGNPLIIIDILVNDGPAKQNDLIYVSTSDKEYYKSYWIYKIQELAKDEDPFKSIIENEKYRLLLEKYGKDSPKKDLTYNILLNITKEAKNKSDWERNVDYKLANDLVTEVDNLRQSIKTKALKYTLQFTNMKLDPTNNLYTSDIINKKMIADNNKHFIAWSLKDIQISDAQNYYSFFLNLFNIKIGVAPKDQAALAMGLDGGGKYEDDWHAAGGKPLEISKNYKPYYNQMFCPRILGKEELFILIQSFLIKNYNVMEYFTDKTVLLNWTNSIKNESDQLKQVFEFNIRTETQLNKDSFKKSMVESIIKELMKGLLIGDTYKNIDRNTKALIDIYSKIDETGKELNELIGDNDNPLEKVETPRTGTAGRALTAAKVTESQIKNQGVVEKMTDMLETAQSNAASFADYFTGSLKHKRIEILKNELTELSKQKRQNINEIKGELQKLVTVINDLGLNVQNIPQTENLNKSEEINSFNELMKAFINKLNTYDLSTISLNPKKEAIFIKEKIVDPIVKLLLDEEKNSNLNYMYELCDNNTVYIKTFLTIILQFNNVTVIDFTNIFEDALTARRKSTFLNIFYYILGTICNLYPEISEEFKGNPKYLENKLPDIYGGYCYANKLFIPNDSYRKIEEYRAFNNTVKLDARQCIAVNRFTKFKNPQDKACFLFHGVGTGKTITSTSIALGHLKQEHKKPETPLRILVIAPQGIFRASFMGDAAQMGIYCHNLYSYYAIPAGGFNDEEEEDAYKDYINAIQTKTSEFKKQAEQYSQQILEQGKTVVKRAVGLATNAQRIASNAATSTQEIASNAATSTQEAAGNSFADIKGAANGYNNVLKPFLGGAGSSPLKPSEFKQENIVEVERTIGTINLGKEKYYVEFIGLDYNALFSKYGSSILNELDFDILICDEAHRLVTNSLKPYDEYLKYDLDCKTKQSIAVESAIDDANLINQMIPYLPVFLQLILKAFVPSQEELMMIIKSISMNQSAFMAIKNDINSVIHMVNFINSIMSVLSFDVTKPMVLYNSLLTVLNGHNQNNASNGITPDQKALLLFSVKKMCLHYNVLNAAARATPMLFASTAAIRGLAGMTINNVMFQSVMNLINFYNGIDLGGLIKNLILMSEEILHNGKLYGNAITDERFIKIFDKSKEGVTEPSLKQAIFLTGTPFQKSNNDIIDIIWFLNNPRVNNSNLDKFCADVLYAGGNAAFKPLEKPGSWKTTKDYNVWFASMGFDLVSSIGSMTTKGSTEPGFNAQDDRNSNESLIVNIGKRYLENTTNIKVEDAATYYNIVNNNLTDFIGNHSKNYSANPLLARGLEMTLGSNISLLLTSMYSNPGGVSRNPIGISGNPIEQMSKTLYGELYNAAIERFIGKSSGEAGSQPLANMVTNALTESIGKFGATADKIGTAAETVSSVGLGDIAANALQTTTGSVQLSCTCVSTNPINAIRSAMKGGAGEEDDKILNVLNASAKANKYLFLAVNDVFNKILKDAGGKIDLMTVIHSTLAALYSLLVSIPEMTAELIRSIINIASFTIMGILEYSFGINSDNVIKHSSPYISIYNYDYNQIPIDENDFYVKNVKSRSSINVLVNCSGDTFAFPEKQIDQILIPYTSEQLAILNNSFYRNIKYSDDELFILNSVVGIYDRGLFEYNEKQELEYSKTRKSVVIPSSDGNGPPSAPTQEAAAVLPAPPAAPAAVAVAPPEPPPIEEPAPAPAAPIPTNTDSNFQNEILTTIKDGVIGLINSITVPNFSSNDDTGTSEGDRYIKEITISLSSNYKNQLKDHYFITLKSSNNDKYNNNSIKQVFKAKDKKQSCLQVNLKKVDDYQLTNDAKLTIPVNIEASFSFNVRAFKSNTTNFLSTKDTVIELFNRVTPAINTFKTKFNVEFGGVINRFEYVLKLLLVIKSGLIYDAHDKFYLHAHYVKRKIGNAVEYYHYLPVIYPPTQEVMYSFISYLNKMGYEYLWMCDVAGKKPLDVEYKAGSKNTYKTYPNIFNEIDESYSCKPSSRLAKEPICIIISPSHTEGFSFNYSPALISLSLCRTSGDAEQVYGRVLRKYGDPSFEEKYFKKIYQLFGGVRADCDNLVKYANKYGSFGQTFKTIYKDIENKKRDINNALIDTLVLRDLSIGYKKTLKSISSGLPTGFDSFIKDRIDPTISRYGQTTKAQRDLQLIIKEKMTEFFATEDAQMTILTTVNDIANDYFNKLVEKESKTKTSDNVFIPYDIQMIDADMKQSDAIYCQPNLYNTILCELKTSGDGDETPSNYFDKNECKKLLQIIESNPKHETNRDEFIELNRAFMGITENSEDFFNNMMLYDYLTVYKKLHGQGMTPEIIIKILREKTKFINDNPQVLDLINENYLLFLYNHWNFEYATILSKYAQQIRPGGATNQIADETLNEIIYSFNREVEKKLGVTKQVKNNVGFVLSPYARNIHQLHKYINPADETFKTLIETPYEEMSIEEFIGYLPVVSKIYNNLNVIWTRMGNIGQKLFNIENAGNLIYYFGSYVYGLIQEIDGEDSGVIKTTVSVLGKPVTLKQPNIFERKVLIESNDIITAIIDNDKAITILFPSQNFSDDERYLIKKLLRHIINFVKLIMDDSDKPVEYNKMGVVIKFADIGDFSVIRDIYERVSVKYNKLKNIGNDLTMENVINLFQTLTDEENTNLINDIITEVTRLKQQFKNVPTIPAFKNYHINPYIPKFIFNFKKYYDGILSSFNRIMENDYNKKKEKTANDELNALKKSLADKTKILDDLVMQSKAMEDRIGLQTESSADNLLIAYEHVKLAETAINTKEKNLLDAEKNNPAYKNYIELVNYFNGFINRMYSTNLDKIYIFMTGKNENTSPYNQIDNNNIKPLFENYLYNLPLLAITFPDSKPGFKEFYIHRFFEINGLERPVLDIEIDRINRLTGQIYKNDDKIFDVQTTTRYFASIIINGYNSLTSKSNKAQDYVANAYEILRFIKDATESGAKDDYASTLWRDTITYDLIRNGQADIQKYNEILRNIPKQKPTGGTRRYRRTKNQRLKKSHITKRFKQNYSINERLYSKKKIRNKTKKH